MTAGSGVIHSEMPEKEFSKNGGKLHGFQLWVNLPKKQDGETKISRNSSIKNSN
ncbi:MAG TPA: pirin family protein [Nitrososphaeraceae archaeon]|nr:pirin family protein [Nitrososphaeraceae archaeon]